VIFSVNLFAAVIFDAAAWPLQPNRNLAPSAFWWRNILAFFAFAGFQWNFLAIGEVLRYAFLALILAPFSALVDGRVRYALVLFTFASVDPCFDQLFAGSAGGSIRTCLIPAVDHLTFTLFAAKRTLSAFLAVPAVFIDLALRSRRRYRDAFVFCASAIWLGFEPLTNRARLLDFFLIVFRTVTDARLAFPLLATAVHHCFRFHCAVVAFLRIFGIVIEPFAVFPDTSPTFTLFFASFLYFRVVERSGDLVLETIRLLIVWTCTSRVVAALLKFVKFAQIRAPLLLRTDQQLGRYEKPQGQKLRKSSDHLYYSR